MAGPVGDLVRRDGSAGEQLGHEEAAQHVGRALDVLGRVAGFERRHALAPPVAVRRADAHQQEVAPVLGAVRGAERAPQREGDPPQLDALDGDRRERVFVGDGHGHRLACLGARHKGAPT